MIIMKPINDYIVERIRVDNMDLGVINNFSPIQGTLRFVFSDKSWEDHVIRCDDWYTDIIPANFDGHKQAIVFWSSKSKYVFFIFDDDIRRQKRVDRIIWWDVKLDIEMDVQTIRQMMYDDFKGFIIANRNFSGDNPKMINIPEPILTIIKDWKKSL